MIDFENFLNEPTTIKGKLMLTCSRAKNILVHKYYEVRSIFIPHNVVKCRNLPRTWVDRDDVLFHAMFQILVDFIELEQPYVDWNAKVAGRFTDHDAMVAFIEDRYAPENREKHEYPSREWADQAYIAYKEILWIYKWYKDKMYEGDTTEWEAERGLIKKCDDMLHRIITFRGHYWT